jgi:ABC-type dipeptide/oligopeptide/nickel transport system permease subunit
MVSLDADFYAIQNVKGRYFWFGTDRLALDNWTRLWIGVRVSLIIALASLIIDFSIGIIYGTIAGFYGGTKVDTVMMRITEILGSIPALVLMIIFLSISKTIGNFIDGILPGDQGLPTIRLIILIMAMSLTGWIGVSRVVRAQILKLREREFVLASRTLGATKRRLMAKHLFPNIIGQIIVMATFSIPGAIFYEAFLTFIGIGLPIPMASLGVLVRDGKDALQTIPSMLWIPATIMSILMLSINLLANGLRDALDPRMR